VERGKSLCSTVEYKWVTAMGGVKFEFNVKISVISDNLSLYTKNDSE